MEVLKGKRAFEIAQKYQPTIYQEFMDVRDCITPVIMEKDLLVYNLLDTIKSPLLYFLASETTTHFYVLYMVYHAFDYSKCGISIINKLDSHRHDTESMLVGIEKSTGFMTLATVSHNSLNFAKDLHKSDVFIEAATHAIYPYDGELFKLKMVMVYNQYNLDNFGDYTKEELDTLEKGLTASSGVNFPTTMCDNILRLQTTNQSNNDLRHEPGDIWFNPERVFRVAERFNRI